MVKTIKSSHKLRYVLRTEDYRNGCTGTATFKEIMQYINRTNAIDNAVYLFFSTSQQSGGMSITMPNQLYRLFSKKETEVEVNY